MRGEEIMRKCLKSLLAFAIALLAFTAFVPGKAMAASTAAMPKISKTAYVTTYALKNAKTTVYSDADCTTTAATLKAGVSIRLLSIDDISGKCSYLSGKKYKTGYVKLTDYIGTAYQTTKAGSAKKAVQMYRRSDCKTKLVKIKKSVKVWTVAKTSKAVQIIAKVGKTYQMGWVKLAAYSSYLASDTSAAVWYSGKGEYLGFNPIILQAYNSSKVLDVKAWGVSNGTNVEIFERDGCGTNQHPNERMEPVSYFWDNSQYYLRFNHSGTYLRCNPNTNNAEISSIRDKYSRFYFHRYGSYYTIECVGNGRYLDVNNAQFYNGNNVHFYSYNASSAQQWKIITCSSNVPFNVSSNASVSKYALELTKGKTYWSENISVTSNYPIKTLRSALYSDSSCGSWYKISGTESTISESSLNGARDFSFQYKISTNSWRISKGKTYYMGVHVKNYLGEEKLLVKVPVIFQ